MIGSLFYELGPWNWMVLGLILLVLEIIVPGVFMLWIGIAALLIGTLSLQLWGSGFWTWQVQVVAFLALSLASAYVGTRIVRSRNGETDQPLPAVSQQTWGPHSNASADCLEPVATPRPAAGRRRSPPRHRSIPGRRLAVAGGFWFSGA